MALPVTPRGHIAAGLQRERHGLCPEMRAGKGMGQGPARQEPAGQGQGLVAGFTAGRAGGRSKTGEGVKAGASDGLREGRPAAGRPLGLGAEWAESVGRLPEQSRGIVPGAGVISKALCAVGVPKGVRMGWLRSNTGASEGKCPEHGETAQAHYGHRTPHAQDQTCV